ncbi:MAG: hypothetical protein RL220_186 [Bacteroidota bacterium]|jgi:hypothetical protein
MAKTGKKSFPRLQIIGRLELISLPGLDANHIIAKIDTGAYRTAIHCISCREIDEGDKTILEAVFDLEGRGATTLYFDSFMQKQVKSSFGNSEMRYCVKTPIRISNRTIISEVALTDRSDMRYQVLIGRKTLNQRFLVDTSSRFLLGSPR